MFRSPMSLEYFINEKGLSPSVAAEDITEEFVNDDDYDEHFDDALEELNKISFDEFIEKYPLQYQKYYVNKGFTKKHLHVSFSPTLSVEIKKIYYSKIGFSHNDIAVIIWKQYVKFYNDPERYSIKNTYNLTDLDIKFTINKIVNSITYIEAF